jgi:hypothetical protein
MPREKSWEKFLGMSPGEGGISTESLRTRFSAIYCSSIILKRNKIWFDQCPVLWNEIPTELIRTLKKFPPGASVQSRKLIYVKTTKENYTT